MSAIPKKQDNTKPFVYGIGFQILLFLLILFLIILLFVPKHDFYLTLDAFFLGVSGFIAPGSWFETELWNAGHFILFFLFAYVTGCMVKAKLKVETLPWYMGCFLLVIFVFIGLLIEYIQVQVGRSFAYSDVWLDGLGAAAGLFLLVRMPVGGRILFSSICMAIGLSSLFEASANLYRMHHEFPVLFDRPDALSLQRVSGNAKFVARQEVGKVYLEVEFGADEYSNVALTEVVRNWSSYKQLVMDWYNPESVSLALTCRIHDKWHRDSDNAIDDRFNALVTIEPGVNRIYFDLAQVQNLPNGRKMSMDAIVALMCFSSHLSKPHPLLLEKVYLQ